MFKSIQIYNYEFLFQAPEKYSHDIVTQGLCFTK